MAKNSRQSSAASQSQAAKQKPRKPHPWYVWIMAATTLLYSLLYFQFGEFIALNQGCGWDGVGYKDLVLMWDSNVKTDAYKSQRILPSLNVRFMMKSAERYYGNLGLALGQRFFDWFYGGKIPFVGQGIANMSRESLVAYFYIHYTVFLLIFSAMIWGFLAAFLAIAPPLRWLGFIGLFVNFAVMKMGLYYPTLTDMSAFFLSILLVYGYLRSWSWLVALAGFAGLFTFPTTFFIAVILFLFPRNLQPSKQSHQANTSSETIATGQANATGTLSWIYSIGVALVFVMMAITFVYIAPIQFVGVEPTSPQVAIIGLLALGITFSIILFPFIGEMFSHNKLRNTITNLFSRENLLPFIIRVCVLILLWGTALFLRSQITDPRMSSPMSGLLFLGGSLNCAVGKPFLSIIAMTVYFGPVILLMILWRKEIAQASLKLGFGFTLVLFVMLLMMCFVTESRQLINFMPFFVVALILSLEANLDTKRAWTIVGILLPLQLFSTKIWQKLNFAEMHQYVMSGGTYANFPIQNYFMNHGPWMIWQAYLWQATAVVICLALLWILARPSSINKQNT